MTEKGLRARLLDECIDRATDAVLRAVAYKKLATCYPTVAQKDPARLQIAHEEVSKYTREQLQSGFAQILETRQMVARLQELDFIIKDARARRDAGGPKTEWQDLTPEQVLQAHLIPAKRRELETMRLALDQVQAENAATLVRLDARRQQLDAQAGILRDLLQVPHL